ncbi:MAG: sucrose-6-phosphate hydrolase [Lachnospiraceae bacterium]|nr:sucrose-6-phosphate hydrolase [Lachnospiraceae bacterium]
MEGKKDYRPHYHAYIKKGWCNDPNGLIYFNGKMHLFFQHYPYKAEWGQMHWAHVCTEDFVKWEDLPLTLEPDQEYEVENGCCSGSTIEVDGKMYLMYTAAQMERQRQCLAVSKDGIHFRKDPNNPILTAEMLSEEVNTADFRDPKVFVHNGLYYALCGVRINDPAATVEKGGYGNMILMHSEDLYHWEYNGYLFHHQDDLDEAFFHLDGVYECPDYFESNGTEIVISSPQFLPQMGHEYENIHSMLYMEGQLDFETGHFHIHSVHELDGGFDIYAAQLLRMPDGRKVMIAWKEMWDRSFPTRSEGWAGTYTLPRVISFHDERLYQEPVAEIEAYRRNEVSLSEETLCDTSRAFDGIEGDCIELSVVFEVGDAKRVGLVVFAGEEHETVLYYDVEQSAVIFDRTKGGIPIEGKEENVNTRTCDIEPSDRVEFRVFLDISSVELFINGGRYTMTGNVYPDPEDQGIQFFAEGGTARIISATKYDIVVQSHT